MTRWEISLASLATLAFATAPTFAQQAIPSGTGGYGAFGDAAVASLLGMNVVEVSGANVGEIERLVSDGNRVMAVVGVGGFLGFGEHDVAVPLAEMTPAEGAVQLTTLVRADLEAMAPWTGEGEELPRNITVSGAPLSPDTGSVITE